METASLWALGGIWGGVFLLMKLAVATVPPVTAAMVRNGIGALVLLAIACMRPENRRGMAAWAPQLLIMGFLNNAIPNGLMAWSLGRIDSGLAAILNALMPPFTVLLAWGLPSRTRPGAGAAFGVALGLLGVAVLVGWDALRGLGDQVAGQLAMVGTAFSYACAAIYGRRLVGLPSLAAAAGQLAGGSLCLLPLSLLAEAPWTIHPSALSLGALGAAGVVGTAVAYLLYFRILALGGPTRLSLVTYIIPLFAVGWGWLVLDERLSWNALAALGLIVGGVLCVNGQAQRAAGALGARLRRLTTSAV